METYLLTQEDIDRLSELDFDMRGVAEGAEAMPSEMEMLRRPADLVAAGTPELLLPPPSAAAPAPVPMAAPAAQPAVEAGSVADTMSPEELASLRVDTNSEEARAAYNAAKPAAPVSGNMAMMQKLVELQTPAAASDDPFANLSKTQRRMLAFSALSDAGAALAGRQGNAFDSLMGRFNDLQDMNRKREAAALQQEMLRGVIGGGMAGPAGAGGIDARKQQAMMLLMNPATVPLGQALLAQIAAEEQAGTTTVAGAVSAANTLGTVESLMQSVKDNPAATGFWGSVFRNVPFTAAGELAIDAQTLRSNMALDALKALKATGATLGSVSEKELELLESDIQKLNLNQRPEKVLQDLEKIRSRYQTAIRSAYENTSDVDALTKALGGRPSWLDGDNAQKSAGPIAGQKWNSVTGKFE